MVYFKTTCLFKKGILKVFGPNWINPGLSWMTNDQFIEFMQTSENRIHSIVH